MDRRREAEHEQHLLKLGPSAPASNGDCNTSNALLGAAGTAAGATSGAFPAALLPPKLLLLLPSSGDVFFSCSSTRHNPVKRRQVFL